MSPHPYHYRSNRLVLTLYAYGSFVSLQKAKFQAAADRLARVEQVGGRGAGDSRANERPKTASSQLYSS
jgi:hypothetical protein